MQHMGTRGKSKLHNQDVQDILQIERAERWSSKERWLGPRQLVHVHSFIQFKFAHSFIQFKFKFTFSEIHNSSFALTSATSKANRSTFTAAKSQKERVGNGVQSWIPSRIDTWENCRCHGYKRGAHVRHALEGHWCYRSSICPNCQRQMSTSRNKVLRRES